MSAQDIELRTLLLPTTASSGLSSSPSPRKKALCDNRINPKYVLVVFAITVLFILIASYNLNWNNRVAYFISETANDFFERTNQTTKERATTAETTTINLATTSTSQSTSVESTTVTTTAQSETATSRRCDPINRENEAYSAVIDGVTYPKSLPLYKNSSINFECLRTNKATKRILAWNPFFGDFSYSKPFQTAACPVVNCEFTSDRKLLDQSDLVIVHMRDSVDEPPATRPSFQRWVFVLYESPIHSGDFSRYNRVFNLTSTYKIESNFSFFYESGTGMRWKPNATFDENHDFYAGKSKFATAVISNCGASSRRLDYIKELQNYVEADLFGRCGKQCPTRYADSTPGECKEILGRDYKFYLAFENSVCEDYITEKFFYILRYPIIPVVLGGGNYEHFIPKSGFINVRDYSSPKQLADYLIYLDGNRTAFNSYFKWKKHVSFDVNLPNFSPICDMCIKLHLEEFFGIDRSVIENIGEHWGKRGNCKNVRLDLSKGFSLENL